MTLDQLPVTYYPKRWSAVGLLLVSLAFVAAGLWMGISGKMVGYLCAAFFSLGAVMGFVQLWPGSAYLKLTREGFEYAVMFRSRSFGWGDIREFGEIEMKTGLFSTHKMVGFNYTTPPQRAGRRLSRLVSGFEGGLPDSYGKRASDLAELMEGLRTEFERGNGDVAG